MARIFGGSTWTRTAIVNLSPDELAAIEAALPPGMTVTLGAQYRPGQWVIHLMLKGKPVLRVDGVRNIPNGVVTAVKRWKAAA